jgi:serine/threonine-protein kinase
VSTDSSAAAQESRAPTWQPGEVVGGKYRIDRPIGQGGMGTVYAALNEETGRRVAVKSLLADVPGNAQAGARLLREARMVGKVHHPNVIDVYDVGRHEGTPFLVMELLDGESLDDLLVRGRIAPDDAIRLIIPAMRGIAAAHALGVVHRDLKPDNIFLCKSTAGRVREVKVLDFGISKTYGEELNDTNLTRSGAILGTPKYMAPEQLANEPVDRRTDVYALGVILYELIAGCLPFEGDTFALLASNPPRAGAGSCRARSLDRRSRTCPPRRHGRRSRRHRRRRPRRARPPTRATPTARRSLRHRRAAPAAGVVGTARWDAG